MLGFQDVFLKTENMIYTIPVKTTINRFTLGFIKIPFSVPIYINTVKNIQAMKYILIN